MLKLLLKVILKESHIYAIIYCCVIATLVQTHIYEKQTKKSMVVKWF